MYIELIKLNLTNFYSEITQCYGHLLDCFLYYKFFTDLKLFKLGPISEVYNFDPNLIIVPHR
jgi:hypothetical protein